MIPVALITNMKHFFSGDFYGTCVSRKDCGEGDESLYHCAVFEINRECLDSTRPRCGSGICICVKGRTLCQEVEVSDNGCSIPEFAKGIFFDAPLLDFFTKFKWDNSGCKAHDHCYDDCFKQRTFCDQSLQADLALDCTSLLKERRKDLADVYQKTLEYLSIKYDPKTDTETRKKLESDDYLAEQGYAKCIDYANKVYSAVATFGGMNFRKAKKQHCRCIQAEL